MKKAPLAFFATTALAMCCFAFQTPVARTFSFVPLPDSKLNAPTQIFIGEISDSHCAGKGSHEAVMKEASVNSPMNCARGCAKKHGLVLVDASKTIYMLDDQAKVLPFAGQQVKVTGTLDKASNAIHVSSIEPVK